MYYIGNLIYGVSIYNNINDMRKSLQGKDFEDHMAIIEEYDEIFVTPYHGSSDDVTGWFGVEVKEFDVIEDIKLDDFTSEIDENHKIEYFNKLEEFKEYNKDMYDKLKHILSKPEYVICWSTS